MSQPVISTTPHCRHCIKDLKHLSCHWFSLTPRSSLITEPASTNPVNVSGR